MHLTLAQRRTRWLALGMTALAFSMSIFQRFAPAGIAPDLAAAFQTSAASLGVLAASYFYVYTITQIPTGILADTLGPRRILLLGGLVGGVGSLLFGLAPTLEVALVGRTLIGLGVSVTFIAMLKIVAVWFEESRFATITGICIVVGNCGAVLAGAPLSALAQITGWRGIFVAAGALMLLIGVGCWLLVRDHPAVEKQPLQRPRFDRTVVLTGLLAVLKNRDTWPAALLNTGISGSLFAFAGLWAVPYLTQAHGMSRSTASSHLSLMFASFAIGAVIVGSLSDRLGRRKPVAVVGATVYALLWLVWLSGWTPPLVLSYLLFALMGVFSASFTLSWACAKEVNPPLLSGMSTSVANMGGFLAAALLQPLMGWVMDQQWDGAMANGARLYSPECYRLGLLLVAATAFVGAIGAWRLRETRCRNIWQG